MCEEDIKLKKNIILSFVWFLFPWGDSSAQKWILQNAENLRIKSAEEMVVHELMTYMKNSEKCLYKVFKLFLLSYWSVEKYRKS